MFDAQTISATHGFCTQHFAAYGYQRLYLIGSRARGTQRPTSDHDVVAVVADAAPDSVLTGKNDALLYKFFATCRERGIAKVDLLVAKASRVDMTNPTPDDLVPYACQQDGKVMWDSQNGEAFGV